jgi:hypothetical protein
MARISTNGGNMETEFIGYNAQDRVTGFAGTITAFCRYLHGNKTVMIEAASIDGKPGAQEWFDLRRITVDRSTPPVTL